VLKEFGVLITCVSTNRWPQLAQTQLIYVDLKKNLPTNQMPQPKMSKQMLLKLRRPVYEATSPTLQLRDKSRIFPLLFCEASKCSTAALRLLGLSLRATIRKTESGMGHAANDENCSCYRYSSGLLISSFIIASATR
jgi:hypothetical protein